ncbi:MAG: Nucleotide sugar dehydrogenase [Microgenomates bacterium 39_7]|nr:MAG: Nucleotide sugar dehydrogenase [Microgenomates bacterium 39_7]
MNITIIGTGFVGAVSAAVYSSLGHQVIGLDVDQMKIESLKKGTVPFFEPNLEDLLIEQQQAGRLSFSANYSEAISNADLVIVAVGTPSLPSGAVDLKYVKLSCAQLAPYLKEDAIVAIKSTVPPGVFSELQPIIEKETKVKFHLAALPEFLKEGTAVDDTLHPDRVVIGSTEPSVIKKLSKLHQPFDAPLVIVTPESAQMIKYTSNAYLATRITFINQIADLCKHTNANIEDVIEGIGYDKRIGHHYWYPGLGYGGSCFPKDVDELAAYAKKIGEKDNLVITISQLNHQRIPKLMREFETLVENWKDKTVAILGLAFKPHTNDTREAPAGKVIPILLESGATVKAYDPKAKWSPTDANSNYQQLNLIASTIQDADMIMVLVEWPEFLEYEFPKVSKKTIFIDSRNRFNPEKITRLGYTYQGIGH